MTALPWFIGYDRGETVAWHTMAQSIIREASIPIAIVPLKLESLPEFTRRDHRSTEFSFSRWLVPYLCGFDGWAVFSDCDMLLRCDPAELWARRDHRFALQCVWHDYRPELGRKFLDREQVPYFRKCWSSLMLLNCERLKMLTPHYVNTADPDELREIRFLRDHLIGSLERTWNHLVDCEPHDPDAKLVHWTLGTPCFSDYSDAPFADEFRAVQSEMNHAELR